MKRKSFFFLSTFVLLGIVASLPSGTGLLASQAQATAQATAGAASAYDPAVCFAAAASNDKTVSYPAKSGPFKLGISNSFVGNSWRTQMIQMATAFGNSPEGKALISQMTIVSSGQDVEAQIAAMDNMISKGVDAIILNAATPDAFNAVIKRAADAGIPVISFDNVVTSPDAIVVNEDQIEFGGLMAKDLVKRLNGKGNVVMVNGVPGTGVDEERQKGAMDVFSQYPDIKVIAKLQGDWDSGIAQTAMTDFLATKPTIDGLLGEAGAPGTIKAL